jgi:hypothetical protein
MNGSIRVTKIQIQDPGIHFVIRVPVAHVAVGRPHLIVVRGREYNLPTNEQVEGQPLQSK